MRRCPFPVVLVSLVLLRALWCTTAPGQVTLVSPEEGRRAIKNLPPAPPRAVSPAVPAPPPAAALVSAARPARATILPERFGGWIGGPTQTFSPFNAATFSGEVAPVLVEYGYSGGERRRYSRGAQTLEMDALRLKDSSGSYGLYTFYRGEDWETRDNGREQIAFRGGELLLRKEEVLVRASLSGGSPGARLNDADLRELISQLETNGGGPLPTLPLYLPQNGLLRKSRSS